MNDIAKSIAIDLAKEIDIGVANVSVEDELDILEFLYLYLKGKVREAKGHVKDNEEWEKFCAETSYTGGDDE